MKLHVFAVWDKKVGNYGTPIFCRALGEAIRSFQDACAEPKSALNMHAEDYQLFKLAEFDDNSGVFEPCTPMPIVSAMECVHVVQEAAAASQSNGRRLPM